MARRHILSVATRSNKSKSTDMPLQKFGCSKWNLANYSKFWDYISKIPILNFGCKSFYFLFISFAETSETFVQLCNVITGCNYASSSVMPFLLYQHLSHVWTSVVPAEAYQGETAPMACNVMMLVIISGVGVAYRHIFVLLPGNSPAGDWGNDCLPPRSACQSAERRVLFLLPPPGKSNQLAR